MADITQIISEVFRVSDGTSKPGFQKSVSDSVGIGQGSALISDDGLPTTQKSIADGVTAINPSGVHELPNPHSISDLVSASGVPPSSITFSPVGVSESIAFSTAMDGSTIPNPSGVDSISIGSISMGEVYDDRTVSESANFATDEDQYEHPGAIYFSDLSNLTSFKGTYYGRVPIDITLIGTGTADIVVEYLSGTVWTQCSLSGNTALPSGIHRFWWDSDYDFQSVSLKEINGMRIGIAGQAVKYTGMGNFYVSTIVSPCSFPRASIEDWSMPASGMPPSGKWVPINPAGYPVRKARLEYSQYFRNGSYDIFKESFGPVSVHPLSFIYDNYSDWKKIAPGDVTDVVRVFTSDGTLVVPEDATYVQVLMVAGGGGGGGRHGGGGGGGEVRYYSAMTLPSGSYSIAIGNGGIGAQSDTYGGNGGDTTFRGETAKGGGGGGSYGGGSYPNGRDGGSGGGAGHSPSAPGSSNKTTPSFGGLSYGNAGGTSGGNEGGGGGGAGAIGGNAVSDSYAGVGAIGFPCSILGTPYYWAGAGGGGGWTQSAGNGGLGGGGGGGRGGSTSSAGIGGGSALNPGGDGVSGTSGAVSGGNGGANTGGGGGGSGQRDYASYSGVGGNGGSGIVVVRYRKTSLSSGWSGGSVSELALPPSDMATSPGAVVSALSFELADVVDAGRNTTWGQFEKTSSGTAPDLKFRASDTLEGLESLPWVAPSGSYIFPEPSGGRYLGWKAEFAIGEILDKLILYPYRNKFLDTTNTQHVEDAGSNVVWSYLTADYSGTVTFQYRYATDTEGSGALSGKSWIDLDPTYNIAGVSARYLEWKATVGAGSTLNKVISAFGDDDVQDFALTSYDPLNLGDVTIRFVGYDDANSERIDHYEERGPVILDDNVPVVGVWPTFTWDNAIDTEIPRRPFKYIFQCIPHDQMGPRHETLTYTKTSPDTGVVIRIFLNSGTLTVGEECDMRILVVAGGGGGGMDMGGGGGGGGVIRNSAYHVTAGNKTVTVGNGGNGAPAAGTLGQPGAHQYTIPATAGGNSVLNDQIAIGGGYGGSSYYGHVLAGAPSSGGSGGGRSAYSDGGYRNGGAGTAGQGYRGGNGGPEYYGGGGGGAGGQGADSTAQANGGPGILDDILGVAYYWAGGGGGSAYSASTGGNGGIGGGGGGAVGTTTGGAGYNNGSPGGGGSPNSHTNRPGGDAGMYTGGGGGGGSHYNSNNRGGNGGKGIVVVRYVKTTSTEDDWDGGDIVALPTFSIDPGNSEATHTARFGDADFYRVWTSFSATDNDVGSTSRDFIWYYVRYSNNASTWTEWERISKDTKLCYRSKYAEVKVYMKRLSGNEALLTSSVTMTAIDGTYARVVSEGVDTSSYSVISTPLANDTYHYYRVMAFDGAKYSLWSRMMAVFVHSQGAPFAPSGMQVEFQTNPTHIINFTPYFSWIFEDDPAVPPSGLQQNARVLVGTADEMWDMWDSGKVPTASGISYAQPSGIGRTNPVSLSRGITYYWRARVWDDGEGNLAGPFSDPATFRLNQLPTVPVPSGVR